MSLGDLYPDGGDRNLRPLWWGDKRKQDRVLAEKRKRAEVYVAIVEEAQARGESIPDETLTKYCKAMEVLRANSKD